MGGVLGARRSEIVAVALLLLGGTALAQEAKPAASADSGQSLDQAANDPTASLMSVQLQNVYAGDYHVLDGETGNTLLLRAAVPFTTGDLKHIARVTLPVVTDSPSRESGLGDIVLFDLLAFDESWGRWGVGPVLLAPTASDESLGADKWAIGPALGFVARAPGLLWGVFNQNLFSFAGDDDREDVDVSIVQPIINYSLPNKWSVGTSEMNITFDWNQEDWVALPLGFKVAKLVRFGRQPVQFSGAYEYNFADDYPTAAWTVNLTVKLLFPVGGD
jgi:hypothetical protein